MLAHVDPADPDHGPRTAKSGTERMCVVTRQVRPVDELIRFVVAPDGAVVPDLKRKLPGRGLWVTAAHGAVADAAKRGLFSRGFKKNVKAAPSLADDTEHLLVRGVVEALAMAAKASLVVAGFGKVEDALNRHQAVALLHASDGADDGIRKLNAKLMAANLAANRQIPDDRDEMTQIPVISALTSAELDLALGRSNVIHAAVLAGPAGKTFLSRSQILVRYRMANDGGTDGKTTPNSQTRPARHRAPKHD
ncbi:MAG: RNA-binding protein [Xanthobacteraceae bacterium]